MANLTYLQQSLVDNDRLIDLEILLGLCDLSVNKIDSLLRDNFLVNRGIYINAFKGEGLWHLKLPFLNLKYGELSINNEIGNRKRIMYEIIINQDLHKLAKNISAQFLSFGGSVNFENFSIDGKDVLVKQYNDIVLKMINVYEPHVTLKIEVSYPKTKFNFF